MSTRIYSRPPIDRECQGTHPQLIFSSKPIRCHPIEGLEAINSSTEMDETTEVSLPE